MNPRLISYLASLPTGDASPQVMGGWLRALVAEQLASLPLPGSGRTLERWRSLASVAGHDLGLCKLYEGHTDALAIMAELNHSLATPDSTWGMWAAEPPQARLEVRGSGAATRINGRKAWCSGAAVLSHGLITAWDEHGQQQLVAVALDQPGVQVTHEGWNAVGMAASGSVNVLFHNVVATRIGEPGAYLARPGFWQGGIGIAACWFGAAASIAQRLLDACAKREEPHALAHLGALDMTLSAAAGMLREAARLIDQQPKADAELLARRCRALVEHACERAIEHAGRAMGAGPYCLDAQFARLIADLPVFLRQSHAERDLAQLGKLLAQPEIPTDRPQPSAGAWCL